MATARSTEWGVAAKLGGAFITAVAPDSLATAIDLRPGDLFVEVQGERVDDAVEARAEIAKLNPTDGMRLRVRRGDMVRYVFLQLSP
jgi:S1-C subfamily serine protease